MVAFADQQSQISTDINIMKFCLQCGILSNSIRGTSENITTEETLVIKPVLKVLDIMETILLVA